MLSVNRISISLVRLSTVLGFMVLSWPGLTQASPGQNQADPYQLGTQLAQDVYNRPKGHDNSTHGAMILIEQGHEPRIRETYSYRLDKGHGKVLSLTRFTAPADIAGVGLLTIDYPGDKSDQWLYLPALERARRIASNRKGGRFVGSDLFYEDLQDREVSMDKNRFVGREKFSGVLCDVVESIPVKASNSVYSKRISWIHPKLMIPLRVDFYESGHAKPIKRLTVQKIEKIQGIWTVMLSTMEDLQDHHKTILKIEKIVYNRKLPDSLFTRQMLEDPVREAKYRP